MRYIAFLIAMMFVNQYGFSQLNPKDTVRNKSMIILRPVTIQQDHYSKHMGYMCKKELQLQKLAKLPLYVRLGSLAYCNQLEGKSH